MIRHKLFQKNAFFAVALSFLCGFLFSFITIDGHSKDMYSFEQMFVAVRDIGILPGEFTSEALLVIMPLCLFAIFIANTVAEDYALIKHYVFIRQKNLKPWYLSNFVIVGSYSLIASLFYNGALLLSCCLFGLKIKNPAVLINVIIYSMVTIFLILVIVALESSVIAFLNNIKLAILFSIASLVISMITAVLLPAKISKWIWISHFYILWHEPHSKLVTELNGGFIPNGCDYPQAFSLGFLVILLLVTAVGNYVFIRKKDYI